VPAPQGADAEVDPGEEVAVLGEQVDGGKDEHVVEVLQTQRDHLPIVALHTICLSG